MLAALRQADPLTDVALERERHLLNLERVAVTAHTRREGVSVVDMARLQGAIGAVESSFNLPSRLQAARFYTPDFLPPVTDRRL